MTAGAAQAEDSMAVVQTPAALQALAALDAQAAHAAHAGSISSLHMHAYVCSLALRAAVDLSSTDTCWVGFSE
jgi:hypothetical protein